MKRTLAKPPPWPVLVRLAQEENELGRPKPGRLFTVAERDRITHDEYWAYRWRQAQREAR